MWVEKKIGDENHQVVSWVKVTGYTWKYLLPFEEGDDFIDMNWSPYSFVMLNPDMPFFAVLIQISWLLIWICMFVIDMNLYQQHGWYQVIWLAKN